jgi:hypothetical protein
MSQQKEKIPDEAFKQYYHIQMGGDTNMFDRSYVRILAKMHLFEALIKVIDDGRYAELMEGYADAESRGVFKEVK